MKVTEFASGIPGFLCRELALRADSHESGTSVIDRFVSKLCQHQHLDGLLFHDESHGYISVKAIMDSGDIRHFSEQLWFGMTMDALCIIAMRVDTAVAELLDNYMYVGREEEMMGEKFFDAIGASMKVPITFFTKEKSFLIVHHDGDPLYLLRPHVQ